MKTVVEEIEEPQDGEHALATEETNNAEMQFAATTSARESIKAKCLNNLHFCSYLYC